MGEAKRRRKLGLPPREVITKKFNDNSDKLFPWIPISKVQISKYPYMPVATMALGLILLLVDWTKFNTAN